MIANVQDHGADPTGAADSSDAFEAALAAAGPSGTVYAPRGTYAVSRPIDPIDRAIVGEYGNARADKRTTIKAMAALPAIIQRSSARQRLSGLLIDATGCVNGIVLTRCHGSTLRELEVKGATGDGIVLHETQVSLLEQVYARENGGCGFLLTGCNATELHYCGANLNSGAGIVATGMQYPGSGTQMGGTVFVIGGDISKNGDAQVWLRGVSGGTVERIYCEGGTADGVKATNKSHNVCVRGCIVSGAGPGRAFMAYDSPGALFDGCSAAGVGSFPSVFWHGAQPTVRDCRYHSAVTPYRLPEVQI